MSYFIITKNKDGSFTNGPALPQTRTIPAHGDIPARNGRPAIPAAAEQTISLPAPTVIGNGRVVTSDTPPTLDQQKAAFGEDALSVAKKAKAEAIFQAAYAALTAIFSSLPAGPQAQFQPVEDAIVKAAKAGDWAKAAEILSTAVVPEGLAAAQAAMVATLTPYLSLASSLNAATTVEAVNAITVPAP